MQKIRILAIAFILTLLFSCSGVNKTTGEENSVEISTKTTSSSWEVEHRRLTREYIIKTEKLDKSEYSILIFSRQPRTKEEKDKYIAVCRELVDKILTVRESRSISKDSVIITFYIPVVKNIDDYCDNIVTNYDYSRAKILTETFNINVRTIAFLFIKDGKYVKMDLSNTDSLEDIELAIGKWKEFIIRAEVTVSEVRITTFFESMFKVALALSKVIVSKS